jgi:cytochrome P450
LDVLGDIGFKYEFSSVTQPNGKFVSIYNKIMSQGMQVIYLVFPFLDLLPHRRRLARDIDEFKDMLLRVIDKRRSEVRELQLKGTTPQDILGMMILSQESEENPLNDTELLVSSQRTF